MGPRHAVLGGRRRVRTAPLEPSVELHMGPRHAVLGGGDACEFRHWDRRWSSLWGHETREGCAEMGVVSNTPAPTGALGGAPYGATKRVRGVPK